MGISMSVENALGQDVEVWLSLRTARSHALKSTKLRPGERKCWTDSGISASCVYDWWVRPSCPNTGRQLGWWKFPCRAPAIKGEHAYRIVHLNKEGYMEFVVNEIDGEDGVSRHEGDAKGDWDADARARIYSETDGSGSHDADSDAPSPGLLKEWLSPLPGSLADAFAAYEALPGGGWSHDVFSPYTEFQDALDEAGHVDVAPGSGLSASELFSAMCGPSGDFFDRYHRRRRDFKVEYSVTLGGRNDPGQSPGASSASLADASAPNGGGEAAAAGSPTPNGGGGGASSSASPTWCGTGFLTCEISTPSGQKPLDTQIRFLACRNGDREEIALHSSGQMSGFPGARSFRSETLYVFSSPGGEDGSGVELRAYGLIRFTSDTYLRSLIQRSAWDGIRKSYPDFLEEVRRTATRLKLRSRDGRADSASSTSSSPSDADASAPEASAKVCRSGPAGQALASPKVLSPEWWWHPVLAPAHLLLLLLPLLSVTSYWF
eukprot:TRINITY_DN74465_c0_g1_i1.p1 TRINITY_DN74465_c0_g1~~TRINITY_DN74465_c0_g1_i1.p1  ORF type:complete len:491 (-),score=83.59 TRINITY_DN74465_c0_g1_i1:76-1548(-)